MCLYKLSFEHRDDIAIRCKALWMFGDGVLIIGGEHHKRFIKDACKIERIKEKRECPN